MQRRIQYYVHYHSSFPAPQNSSWVVPTIYEDKPGIIENPLILSKYTPSIRSLFKNFEPMDDDRIGYLSQTIATEYWILNHLKDVDYVGVSGYRRYPIINYDRSNPTVQHVGAVATNDYMEFLTNDGNLELISNILNTYDVIAIAKTLIEGTVKTQFISNQGRVDIWDNFIDSICLVAPEYKPWINWFNLENQVHYCGPMGLTPLPMFKEYADMYSRIIANMLQNIEDPFLCSDDNLRFKSDRWIGYMAERFYPFFLFVNNVKIYQVPMVHLADPKDFETNAQTSPRSSFWRKFF